MTWHSPESPFTHPCRLRRRARILKGKPEQIVDKIVTLRFI
jgi:hypothetical protein